MEHGLITLHRQQASEREVFPEHMTRMYHVFKHNMKFCPFMAPQMSSDLALTLPPSAALVHPEGCQVPEDVIMTGCGQCGEKQT